MALHEMTAKPTIDPHRPLEINRLIAPEGSKRADAGCFGANIRMQFAVFDENNSQADAIDRNAVAGLHL